MAYMVVAGVFIVHNPLAILLKSPKIQYTHRHINNNSQR